MASYEPPAWVTDDLGGPTGKGVRIGLVDSGIDHDWAMPGRRQGVDLTTRPKHRGPDRQDLLGHGTACASILWALAPELEIFPIRVFDRRLETRVTTLVEAIDWAIDHGMRVINLSLGTIEKKGYEHLYRACERARQQGVIVVAAVEVRSGVSYPAVFDNAIGVNAGRFAKGYDYEYRPDDAVECLAQGHCRARGVAGLWHWVDASSFAAPHLSALVGLLLERHPEAGLDEIHDLLTRYAVHREDSDS